MRDHDDGAREFVDRFGKRSAAVDIEMVGRFVEDDHVGAEEGRKPEQQPRLLAAGQALDQGVAGLARKADRADACAHLALRRIRHQPADMIVGRAVGIELVELVLGEIADRQFFRARDAARKRRELAGEQFHQGRLAVAVGSEQRDAVVGVDPQGDAVEHRLFRLVADRDLVDRDDRRRQHFLGRRKRDVAHVLRHQRGDRLHPLQHFHARLRLARLRGLGLEAVDKGLQPLALVGLPLGVLGVEHFARGALFLERGVGALVERQLAAIEVQDLVDRGVEQVAVMADDDHGARIVRQMILEPQRAFEIEIVGGLVQQQQIGRGEQRRGERDPHAPAAGKFRTRTRLVGGRKSEAAQDRGRARRRRVGVDVDEPGLDLGDPVRIVRGLGLAQQRVALEIGLQHDFDQAFRAVGRFLRKAADPPARRDRDRAGLRSADRRGSRETASICRRRCGRQSRRARRARSAPSCCRSIAVRRSGSICR